MLISNRIDVSMNYISRCIKNNINSRTSWPSASEKFLIHAMFSSTVGKLAKSDEIMGKTSTVFLERRIKPLSPTCYQQNQEKINGLIVGF